MWAGAVLLVRQPDQFITSGGLGTMGFEVPAAIGVQFARPERHGLGDLRRRRLPDDACRSWRRCTEYELPVKFAIINNGYLGMVRQWQELFYDEQHAVRAHVPARLREAGRGLGITRHARQRQGRRSSASIEEALRAPGRRAAGLPGRRHRGLLPDGAARASPVRTPSTRRSRPARPPSRRGAGHDERATTPSSRWSKTGPVS